MKFEIDEKSGRIFHLDVDPSEIDEPSLGGCTLNACEQILKAIKKTQEKLMNREIQAVQDSKNVERDGLGFVKSVTIDSITYTANQIRENQEIVDKIKDQYTFALYALKRNDLSKKDKIQITYLKTTIKASFNDLGIHL